MCWREEGEGQQLGSGAGGGHVAQEPFFRGANEHSAINSLRNTWKLCRSEKRDDSLERSKRSLVHKAGKEKKKPTSSCFRRREQRESKVCFFLLFFSYAGNHREASSQTADETPLK